MRRGGSVSRPRLLVGVTLVAALAIAVAIYAYSISRPLLDLSRGPQTVFVTNPFEVGESYTLGSMGVPLDVVRPVTVSDVRVLETSGVEVVGRGLFDPATRSEGIGLVPGWPPEVSHLFDLQTQPVQWSGEVAIVVGLRTVAPKSGLRGIQVRWVDGNGRSGERVFDLAVLTCAPGACEAISADAAEPMLKELGLLH